jgi:hypothetical protein
MSESFGQMSDVTLELLERVHDASISIPMEPKY